MVTVLVLPLTQRQSRRRARLLIVASLVAAAVALGPSAASAKEFGPGDLRICNAHRCLPVIAPGLLSQLSAFYYSDAPPSFASTPRLGAIDYELRFSNGYVTGIVATDRLDRFLSYGVNTGRFEAGQWYRLLAATARALHRLSVPLAPLHLTVAAEQRSR